MPKPWNDWYHCNGNTYGTWLRGDKRGWRSRHHREHCEGDYKNPPPEGRDEWLRKHSKRLMKKEPVFLTPEQQRIAGRAMVKRLLDANIELLSLVVDDHHFHLVARFSDHEPRRYIGRAKQYASFLLIKQFDLTAPVWAKRCRCLPIENRRHQVKSVNYDLDHAKCGASFVWSFREHCA